MDRHAKKLEKKRKQRALVKKQVRSLAAQAPTQGRLVQDAPHMPMGPCWISAEWQDMNSPALVTAVVTRSFPDGQLLPGIALVDRTCLGVKNGLVARPIFSRDVEGFIAHIGRAHRAMVECEPLIVQSVVYHAIDYARRLGFEPHRDFPAPLFGPRPDQLLDTPWRAPEKPWYFSGPNDNVAAITGQLSRAVGDGNFDYMIEVSRAELENHGVEVKQLGPLTRLKALSGS